MSPQTTHVGYFIESCLQELHITTALEIYTKYNI